MKLSISWIFDHIDEEIDQISIDELVAKFNRTTAEIEKCSALRIPLERLALAKIVSSGKEKDKIAIRRHPIRSKQGRCSPVQLSPGNKPASRSSFQDYPGSYSSICGSA